jgi:hypothetical protein
MNFPVIKENTKEKEKRFWSHNSVLIKKNSKIFSITISIVYRIQNNSSDCFDVEK